MLQILKSLVLTITVSTCIGYFLTNFNINFWSSFFLITIIQIVIWNIFQYIQESKLIKFHAEQEQQVFEQLSKQSVVVPCQSCGHESLVPIGLDRNNTFDCDKCNKTNAIYIDIETAIVTTPVESLQTVTVNEQGTRAT
jgi:hypothetical protein